MKKYLTIITISSLVGTALALYVLARLPWMTTATMMILVVCVVSWVDYRRVTTNKRARASDSFEDIHDHN